MCFLLAGLSSIASIALSATSLLSMYQNNEGEIRATKKKGKKRALSAVREGLDWIWFLKLFVFLYSSLYLVLLWKTMDLRVLANMVIYLFCVVACIIYVSFVHYWWCTVAVRF